MPRICSKCGGEKEESLFPPRKRGLQCYACLAAAKRAWCANNPEKVVISRKKTNEWHKQNKDRVYNNIHKYRYGITQADADLMSVRQNNLCAICKQSPQMTNKRNQKLFLDHCHATGKIRGMLCNNCNIAIGHAKESVEILKAMITYLKTHD